MQQIPKIIHYVWVGGAPLSPLAERCLASWQKYLPEYEIKRWDEHNSPMQHPYVAAMYAKKKWAFVSDYIRFWVLQREGGIYLDTDMEIFKPLDPFLIEHGFVGRSKRGDVESSIIGAVPQAAFISEALRFYDTDTRHSTEDTSPRVLAAAIAKTNDHVRIFDYTYFHPCDEGERCDRAVIQAAYGRHHWAESWVPFAGLRKLARRLRIHKLKRLFS